jgi:glycosyltransferase involved in cell wall biosynthesis
MTEFKYTHPTKLKSVSIVLPAYNEEKNMSDVIKEALTVAKDVTDLFEIIVVDDGSSDGTAALVERLSKLNPGKIRLIKNNHNMGYGPTVRRGLRESKMDWVFFTDADGQFEFADIKKFIPFTDRFDFVVGNRKKRQDKFYRRLNAGIFNIAVRVFFNIKVRDIDCAFKLMKRSKLDSLELITESAMINTEILHKAKQSGFKIKEICVSHLSRKFGEATGADRGVIKKAIHDFYMLRWQLLRERPTLMKINSRIVFLVSLLAAVAMTYWSYKHSVILAYGDAEAHLNIAKRVVSGLTPGYAQLGGIWLPLPHILMMPFVINNWLWRSGIGGSVPSIIAFVWLAVILYKLAYSLTGNFVASYIAPLAVILNPNALYLASTPMTEILMLSMFATSVYFFIKWQRSDKLIDLILASLFTALAGLSRYDGWALVFVEVTLLILFLIYKKLSYKAIEGITLVYSFIAFSSIFLWLVWNKLIFGSFTYFSASVYGSKVQQQFFLKNGYLPTYHNLPKSILYFFEDMRLVVGLPILILAAIGMTYYIYWCIAQKKYKYLTLVALVLTPIAFYVLSLFVGQASLILPTFAKVGAAYSISNVRYGLQILLAVAVFLAFLAGRIKKLTPLIAIALLIQCGLFIKTGQVITYVDGTSGLSSQKISKGIDAPAVESYMKSHYDSGLVLMDDYRRPIGLVESGIPMNRFIGSGNKPYWNESFDDPGKYANWIIVQKSDTDAVWTGIHRKDLIDSKFALVYSKGTLYVYKKRVTNTNYVVRSGQHLLLSGKPFVINGTNVYDILSLDDQTIDRQLRNVSDSHFNTVRIWCFNKQGKMDQSDFDRLDSVLASAKRYNIRIICVLGNTQHDYGGPEYFGAANNKDFFSNKNIIGTYTASITNVIKHVSHLDHQPLSKNSSILAWELINEPRIEGEQDSATIDIWMNNVGSHILSLDQSHLISPGTEGFTSTYIGQYYNESHGASIEDVCKLEVISLCTGHLYPKYISSDKSELGISPSGIGTITHTWRAISDKLNKPFYIGEAGYDMSSPGVTNDSRASFFARVKNASVNDKLDGFLIWNTGTKTDKYFTLQYGDPASEAIFKNWSLHSE